MDSPTNLPKSPKLPVKKLPKLLVKKLHKDAIIPKKGSPGAAGYDLYALEDCTLFQFQRKLF